MKSNLIILTKTEDKDFYEMTQNCINSIHASEEDIQFDIIVMESRSDCPFVYSNVYKVITPDEEFNYNRFVNIARKSCDHDWITIASNDTIYRRGWFSALMRAKKLYPHALSFSSWCDKWHEERRQFLRTSDPVRFGYRSSLEVAGWCITAHKKVFEIIGDLDEQFNFWCQDDDYGLMLQEYDLAHALVETSKVDHLIKKGVHGKSHSLLNDFKEDTEGQKKKLNAKWEPKVYDAFIFYNELELLDLRLNILKEEVDEFVLVESTRTFSGEKKPLYFDKVKDRFKEFPIKHIILDDMPIQSKIENAMQDSPAWLNEAHIRKGMLKGLTNVKKNDRIIMSDVDEIPDPRILRQLNQSIPSMISLALRFYYFYFNYQCIKGEKMLPWSMICNKETMNWVLYDDGKRRVRFKVPHTVEAGWHFSHFGDNDRVTKKIKTGSHQENNINKFTKNLDIKELVANRKDLFNRETHEWEIVEIDKTYPDYLLKNLDKYSKYIYDDTPIKQ